MQNKIRFYDQKNRLLECECGYIWKPLVKFDDNYKKIKPGEYTCPNCREGVK